MNRLTGGAAQGIHIIYEGYVAGTQVGCQRAIAKIVSGCNQAAVFRCGAYIFTAYSPAPNTIVFADSHGERSLFGSEFVTAITFTDVTATEHLMWVLLCLRKGAGEMSVISSLVNSTIVQTVAVASRESAGGLDAVIARVQRSRASVTTCDLQIIAHVVNMWSSPAFSQFVRVLAKTREGSNILEVTPRKDERVLKVEGEQREPAYGNESPEALQRFGDLMARRTREVQIVSIGQCVSLNDGEARKCELKNVNQCYRTGYLKPLPGKIPAWIENRAGTLARCKLCAAAVRKGFMVAPQKTGWVDGTHKIPIKSYAWFNAIDQHADPFRGHKTNNFHQMSV